MSKRDRKCLAKYIIRTELGRVYTLALSPDLTDYSTLTQDDIPLCIAMKIPLSFYITVCTRDHIRDLLVAFPCESVFIYDTLIARYI